MIKILFFLLTFSLLASAVVLEDCSSCDMSENNSEMQDCHNKGSDMAKHNCCPLCHNPVQYLAPLKVFKVYADLEILNQLKFSNSYKSLATDPQIRPPILS